MNKEVILNPNDYTLNTKDKTLEFARRRNTSTTNKIRILLRPSVIPTKTIHILATDFAKHVIPEYTGYFKPWVLPDLITLKHLWLRGSVSSKTLMERIATIWIARPGAGADWAVVAAVRQACLPTTDPVMVANLAIDARTYGKDIDTEGNRSPIQRERRWQIDHIVKTIEAMEWKENPDNGDQ